MFDWLAPAFITTAPPTVPGMPPANSSPARPRRAHWAARPGREAPASTWTVASWKTTRPRGRAMRITRPRTPSSATSRLVPAPMMVRGTPASAAAAKSRWRRSTESGETRRSAGPPTRRLV